MNTNCSVNIPNISAAFISKSGNELLSSLDALRYVDYINTLFGNVFEREYLDNSSYTTLSDFNDDSNKLSVNGNLIKLYNLVLKELKTQVFDNTASLLPIETIKNIDKIVKNWDLFVKYHSKYNAYIVAREEDFDEEKQKEYFDRSGNEYNEFELVSNEVRTLFKFLPKAKVVNDINGKRKYVKDLHPVDGLPIRADFETIIKLTLDATKGIRDESKFIEALTSDEFLNKVPEFSFLFGILPIQNGVDGLTDKQSILFNKFYISFSRADVPIEGSIATTIKNETKHIRYPAGKSNIKKIEESFISKFIANSEENEHVKKDASVDSKNPENNGNNRMRLFSLLTIPDRIDLSTEEIEGLSNKKIQSDYKQHFDLLKLLGVSFSDLSALSSFSDKKDLIAILNSTRVIHENISSRLKKDFKLYSPINDIQNEKKNFKIVNLRSVVQNILNFEGKFSKVTTSLVSKNSKGQNQSDISLQSAITIAVNELNESNSLDDLYSKSYFKKLKFNPLHKYSYTLNTVIGTDNQYVVRNYSGHTTVNSSNVKQGYDTKELTAPLKFVSDVNNLTGWGTINTPQLEAKSGYPTIKYLNKNGKVILPFTYNNFTKKFISGDNTHNFTKQILGYLQGELDRVKWYNTTERRNYTVPKGYGELHIFERFVNKEQLASLLEKGIEGDLNILNDIKTNINKYFNDELIKVKDFIKKNQIKNFLATNRLNEMGVSEDLYKNEKEYIEDLVLRTHIANSFIFNIEFGIFISGDPLFFKDWHKRLGGLASTGIQPSKTRNMKNYFNSTTEKTFWDNFSLRGILNQSSKNPVKRRDNSETFLSAVVKDVIEKKDLSYLEKATMYNYAYSYKLNTGKELTIEQVNNVLKINKLKKDGITVSDGQGWMNIDAARELGIEQGTGTPQQDVSYKFEALVFKRDILDIKLTDDETKHIKKLERQILSNPDKYAISTRKQTYYGTISNKSVEIDGKVFDKFSLATLFPSTARNHPELKKLLLVMAEKQITYVKGTSGSKAYIRHTFEDVDELGKEGVELDELETNLLKLQILPSEHGETKIPTQTIKLLFTNLFDKGDASENVKKLRNNFIDNLNNIRDLNKKTLFKRFGFKLDSENNITSWDKGKIIDALITQVNLQKLPSNLLEALKTDENGNFINTIESSGIYQQLLNYVTGVIDSSLREFKVNGGDFVLISEAFFSRPLKYFSLNRENNIIEKLECRVTLNKEFSKLLNLPDPANTSKKIESIDRLNELLNNEEFRKKYDKELTISFSRPPVQGTNSMGVAKIVEFFHPTHGSVIQLPKEFMWQAGIDFDYDKEKVLIPHLTEDGLYVNEDNLKNRFAKLKETEEYKNLIEEKSAIQDLFDDINNKLGEYETEEQYEEAKQNLVNDDNELRLMLSIFQTDIKGISKEIDEIPIELETIKQLINRFLSFNNEKTKLSQNKLLSSMIDALLAPESYSELIVPNNDSTVKELGEQNGKDTKELNTLPTGVGVYSYMENLNVFKMFNEAKALLGPFALHNVFSQLISPLDILVNLDYKQNAKGVFVRRINLLISKNKDRAINISKREDDEGNNKQHITSEFINATVDAAKDPYFTNFMLSFDNINTFVFLHSLNIPVNTIVDFISNALIRKYLEIQKNNPKLKNSTHFLVKKAFEESGVVPTSDKMSLIDILDQDKKLIGVDNSILLENLKKLKNSDSFEDRGNDKYHTALLFNFIAMNEHAKGFSDFKNLFKNDTNKTSSLFEIKAKELLRDRVVNTGMFSEESVERVENHSTMTSFRNDETISKILKEVFPLLANLDIIDTLGDLYTQKKSSIKEVDSRILSQVVTNDFITSILYTFGTYKNRNFFDYGKDLVARTKKDDGTYNTTLVERIQKLKQNPEYKSLVKVFPVLDKIYEDVSQKIITNNHIYNGGYAYNMLLNIDSNVPLIEKENFISQFKKIVNGEFETKDPKIKEALVNFIKDFFIVGMIQSGLNPTSNSFFEYAPIDFVQSLLNPALNNYHYYSQDRVFIDSYHDTFKQYFKLNNSKYFRRNENAFDSTYLGKYYKISDIPMNQLSSPKSVVVRGITPTISIKTKENNVILPKEYEVRDNIELQNKEIKGINIRTDKSNPNSLGNRLTNPNWYAKDLFDVESAYKAGKTGVLKDDMNLMYTLQLQKFRKNPELIDEINAEGGLAFIEASEHTVGVINNRWEGKGLESNFIKVLAKSYTTVAKELGKFIESKTIEDTSDKEENLPNTEDTDVDLGEVNTSNIEQLQSSIPTELYKDKRIKITYPNTIEYEGESFNTNKLLEIKSVFTNIDDGTISDQREFKTEAGDNWLMEYGMSDSEYKYALKNEQVLANLLSIAEDTDSNFKDIIDMLLNQNEILTDTTQLPLFSEEELKNLDDIGFKKTCN